MKPIRYKFTFLLAAIVLILASCYKDSEQVSEEEFKDKPRVVVEKVDIVSNVVDEEGKAIEGITAKYSNQIKVVENSNYFHFTGNKVNKYFEVLEITDKEGEKYEYTLPVIENEVCYFKPVLYKNTKTTTIPSNVKAAIDLSNDLQIAIQPLAYLKDKKKYDGNVSMRYNAFDLSNPLQAQALPGGYIGIDKNNSNSMLLMTKAFKIEVASSDKQTLGFDGATLNYKGYSKGQLYYYNAAINSWVYESDIKEGTVSIAKSGIYCIAETTKYHHVKGRLLSNGRANANVKLTLYYDNYSQSIYTTNTGAWETVLPNNKEVTVKYDIACSVNEKKLAPSVKDEIYSADILDIGIVSSHFIGTIKDCEDNISANSFFKITTDASTKVFYSKDGAVDFYYAHCATSKLKFSSLNEDLSQVGPDVDWKPGTTNNLYASIACNLSNDAYLILRSQDGKRLYHEATCNYVNDKLIIVFKDAIKKAQIKLSIKANDIGNIDPSLVNIELQDPTFGSKGYELNCPTSKDCGFTKMEISHFGKQKGEWIKGKFDGKFWMKLLNPLSASNIILEGEFQLKREF